MNWSQIFASFGLFLDALGAFVLIFPNLKGTRKLDDDYITSMDKETGEYTQMKHIRDRNLNLIGLALLVIGFILQFVGTF